GEVWAPTTGVFGALPFIAGTLYSTGIGLILGAPVALGIALYLTQWAPNAIRRTAGLLVDLAAAVPSVVYGLWGIWVLAPAIGGLGLLTAGLILAVMVVPTIAAVARDVMASETRGLSDSALALGATPWEAASLGVLRPCRAGLIAAVWLGLGRALGETIAVAMVIGNQSRFSPSVRSPGQTLTTAIVNQLDGAGHGLYASALIEIGLLLFVVSALVTLVARNYAGRVHAAGRR
ncbi:MAG TPA: phosphate ABC transporter permease subunit PstC, partial [Limnochordia bacterium]|nr:phosphate ABC transporter permease subunit PstC [Limnochordia bacterium]